MSNAHVSRADLEAYVIGALDEANLAVVEAHVMECAACEARLQHEAQIEIAFTRVAAQHVEEKHPRRIAYVATVAGAALAMAAGVLLWIGARGDGEARQPNVEEPNMVVSETASIDASTFTAQLDVHDGASRSSARD